MKKILVIIVLTVLLMVVPNIVFAGYGDKPSVDIQTRLEVSKDNINWINFNSETNAGNQTLTVAPGDTLYFRLTTENFGDQRASGVQFLGSYTNPSYIESLNAFDGANDDIDGDGRYYYITSTDQSAGTINFNFDYFEAAGYEGPYNAQQIGVMGAKLSSTIPDQAEIIVTVTVNAGIIREDAFLFDKLFPRVYADDQGTTQVRILVSNPTATQTSATSDPSYRVGKGY